MKVTYATTKPSPRDSKWIARQKWLQEKNTPSTADSGTLLIFDGTAARASDGQTRAYQKILQQLHS